MSVSRASSVRATPQRETTEPIKEGSTPLWSRAVMFVLACVVLAYYVGYFDDITGVSESQMASMTLVVTARTGGFDQIGDALQQVASELKSSSLLPTEVGEYVRSAGVYFDDPATATVVRWYVGFVATSKNAAEAKKMLPDNTTLLTFDLPASRIIGTSYQYRSMLSFILGPSRAYPALQSYVKANFVNHDEACPALEFYDAEVTGDDVDVLRGARYTFLLENCDKLPWLGGEGEAEEAAKEAVVEAPEEEEVQAAAEEEVQAAEEEEEEEDAFVEVTKEEAEATGTMEEEKEL